MDEKILKQNPAARGLEILLKLKRIYVMILYFFHKFRDVLKLNKLNSIFRARQSYGIKLGTYLQENHNWDSIALVAVFLLHQSDMLTIFRIQQETNF